MGGGWFLEKGKGEKKRKTLFISGSLSMREGGFFLYFHAIFISSVLRPPMNGEVFCTSNFSILYKTKATLL